MDVNLSCALCGFELSAEETDGPGAEHLTQLWGALHTPHTPKDVNSYIWANGSYPIGAQRRRPEDKDQPDQ